VSGRSSRCSGIKLVERGIVPFTVLFLHLNYPQGFERSIQETACVSNISLDGFENGIYSGWGRIHIYALNLDRLLGEG